MIQLRPFQKDALKILGTDPKKSAHLLCIAPTGSGKSLIYERIALQPGRRILVITPLVALGRQQFANLQALGAPSALSAGESRRIPPPQKSGAWIISPEMLPDQGLHPLLARWRPNLLVVDECHCLWDWGENFRPAFQKIPGLIQNHRIPQSLWMTATLAPRARRELKEILPHPYFEIGSFDLPDLLLKVLKVPWAERVCALMRWAELQKKPSIVFVCTRASTARVARILSLTGKPVAIYHGGMPAEERKAIELRIRRGGVHFVVATSAFGMGMDYPALKSVLLWQAPSSVLSLVQTIGRVGRGDCSSSRTERSNATIFWDHDDFRLLEWTLGASERRRDELVELGNFFQSNVCRKLWLKHYFSEESAKPLDSGSGCAACDLCLNG